MTVQLREILKETKARAREDILGKNPNIHTSKKFNSRLDLDRIGPESKTWYEIDDVVAVFADLRGSTNLNRDSNKATVASIYEGSTGGIVSIFRKFDPKYIQVQGDGVLALFWGEKLYENAICSAITVKTFGKDVEKFIQDKKNDDNLISGYRIGIASSSILVKRVGDKRGEKDQSFVWSGNAVNYAVKASEQSSSGSLVLSSSVWGKIESNEYLTTSCDCSRGYSFLWEEKNIDKIQNDEKYGAELKVDWCNNCGETFCNMILSGETKRPKENMSLKQLTILWQHIKRKGGFNN